MKKRRIVSAVLALTMAASLMACGGNANSKDGGTKSVSSQDSSQAGKERVPIRWLTTGDTAAAVIEDGDRIIEAINEKLGIDLTVELVPEGSTEKVNVAMASGDFPDVVTGSYGTSAVQQWIENGMVIPLNNYFEGHPAMEQWLEDYEWTAVDGNYYGLPAVSQAIANALIVMRQDWLDELGLAYPKNLDEMKTVLEAFTFQDPDGNGINDTYGFTATKPTSSTPFDWVFFANGLPYADYSLDGDGNVIPWFEDPSFIPSMHYIKDLWDSGVIDPELMLNTNSKKEEKFFQGKAGSMLAALFRHVSRIESSLQELYPEAAICYEVPPAGTDGVMGMNKPAKTGTINCVTTACKNPDKAVDFLNFMASEEGRSLLLLGIEGVHYTKDGETIVFNEEERAKDAFSPNGWAHALAWGSFGWPLDYNYIPASDPDRERAMESVEIATKALVTNLVKQKTNAEINNGGAVNDVFVQYFSDMLQGKISIEEGVKKLSSEWRAQGGEEILTEVNEVYSESK